MINGHTVRIICDSIECGYHLFVFTRFAGRFRSGLEALRVGERVARHLEPGYLKTGEVKR